MTIGTNHIFVIFFIERAGHTLFSSSHLSPHTSISVVPETAVAVDALQGTGSINSLRDDSAAKLSHTRTTHTHTLHNPRQVLKRRLEATSKLGFLQGLHEHGAQQ